MPQRQRAKWRHYTVKDIKSAVNQVEKLVYKRQASALEQHPVLPPSAFTSTRVPQLHGSLPMPTLAASSTAGRSGATGQNERSETGSGPAVAFDVGPARRLGSPTGHDVVRMSRTAPRPTTLAALDTLLPADDGTLVPARVLATSHGRNSLRHLSMSAPVGLVGGLSLPPSPLPAFSPTSRASASPTNRGLLSPMSRGEERPGWSSTPPRTPSRGASRGALSLTATWRSASPGQGGIAARAVGDSFGGPAERTRTPPATLASMFARPGSSQLPPSTPVTGAGAAEPGDADVADADGQELGTTVSSLPLQPYVFVPAPEPKPLRRRPQVVVAQGPEAEAAATRMQSAMRGRAARRRVARLRGEDDSEEARIMGDVARLDERLRLATPLRQARAAATAAGSADEAVGEAPPAEHDAAGVVAEGAQAAGGDTEAGGGSGEGENEEEELLSALDDIDSKLKRLKGNKRQPRRRRQSRTR